MLMQQSEYNPFNIILEYIPEVAEGPLTLEQLEMISGFLELGGIHCESPEEVVKCLFLMRDLNLLAIKEFKNKNEIYYEVTKIYGKC